MDIYHHDHGLSPTFVQRQLKRHELALRRQREALSRRQGSLELYQRTALDYAGYLMLDRSKRARQRLRQVLIQAEATTEALLALALATSGRPVRLTLNDRLEITRSGAKISGPIHASTWLEGFHLSQIFQQPRSMNLLMSISADLLRGLALPESAFVYSFIESIQRLMAIDTTMPDRLIEALLLAGADPAAESANAALQHVALQVGLLLAIANNDANRFNAELSRALASYRELCETTATARRDPCGLLTLGPLAFAAIALRHGHLRR